VASADQQEAQERHTPARQAALIAAKLVTTKSIAIGALFIWARDRFGFKKRLWMRMHIKVKHGRREFAYAKLSDIEIPKTKSL
jgi:hypothetical protein